MLLFLVLRVDKGQLILHRKKFLLRGEVLKRVEVDADSLDRLRTTVEPSKIDTVCLMISEIKHGLLANRG